MSEKLTIKDETAAIDYRAKDLWENLTDDQRKQISFYLLLRYASDVKTSNNDLVAMTIMKTNEYYNKHFFSLSKHPSLLWYLVCMTGNGEKDYFHEYIKYKQKSGDNKIYQILENMYPTMKQEELEYLAQVTTKEEIKEYARSMGMDDDAIKKMV